MLKFTEELVLRITPETEEEAVLLAEYAASLQQRIEVLPLPHDESVFYQDDTITREDNLIVSVTRFTEQKRVVKLIRAFDWVARRDNSARLELLGFYYLPD